MAKEVKELKNTHSDTTIEQSYTPGNLLSEAEITHVNSGSEGFSRLTVKSFSQFWLTLEVTEVRKGRAYTKAISIPKGHVEMLAQSLSDLAKKMKTIPKK